MQIDWLTVSAQIVNFLVLVWLLKHFLYQPVINAMTRREERIAARLQEAEKREDDAEARARDYLAKTEALEQTREEKLDEARAAAEREKRQLLDEARQEIDRQREKWRQELRREQNELRNTLKRELAESAVRIARRTLEDLADATLEHQIVAALLDRWKTLPESDREPFQNASGTLRVTSSFELDDDIRKRLREALRAPVDIDYARDRELLCGIALTGAGHKLEWNINDYLDDAENRIREQLGASAPEEHA